VILRVLFLGDIVGRPGRKAIAGALSALKDEFKPQVVIANGENAAGGFGIQPKVAEEIYAAGVDVITLGDHAWDRRELFPFLNGNKHRMVRPINFAEGAPGTGALVWEGIPGVKIGVLNALGRVFIDQLVDCPFKALERAIDSEPIKSCDVVFVDFQAEATSEKIALGYHLVGKAQIVVGTHTHVQTADERILDGKTAFISDVGMCGPYDGVIGVDREAIVTRFLTGIKQAFDVAAGRTVLNGVVVDVDVKRRVATQIQRINRVDTA
jgi:metallophosphoesterase (TIGR00282 family)